MTGDDSTDYDPASDIPEDPRIVEVVEDYLHELQAGARPDRQAYLDRYPELAESIRACLEGLDLVHAGVGSRASLLHARTRHEPPGQVSVPSPLGDFQIVRELARGGMGVVYEAIQLSLARRVALKVLPFAATFDSRQLQRFKNEAQAAALLHHTHIVPIYAVGCERGVHFYAMQLIEGQSLAAVIQQLREREGRAARHKVDSTLDRTGHVLQPRASVPGAQSQRSTVDVSGTITGGSSLQSETYIRRAARLVVQAAEALEHAHQEGVIHRDVKPANLLVDATGNLWITDFGLAQLQADNGLTRSGDVLGTFRYMSPEQTSGQRTVLDHRTDIYSLGATLYELVTLEPAFTGETHQELLYQILHSEPVSPRELNRAIPVELETIILKALSKSAADRYRSAAEFGADLQRFLDHQPILARRPSPVDRLRKWSRRHPGVALASILVMTLVAGLSLISQYRIAVEQGRTKDALAREELRATEAEQRFQQARQAVDALFQISEEELADKPGEGARRRILEIVLNYYQDFIEQRRGDSEAQAELALVQEKIKAILRELTVLQREMHTRLLASDAVRSELQLSAAQEAKLTPLVQQWMEEHRAVFEDRQQTEEERRTRLVANAEAHERALAQILTSQQQTRFGQIALQSQGLFAFRDPDIVKALALTNAQRAQLRDIERSTFMRRFGHGPGGPRPDGPRDERSREDRGGGDRPGGDRPGPARHPVGDETMSKALAVLTSEQLVTWREMTGEPSPALQSEDGLPLLSFGPPR